MSNFRTHIFRQRDDVVDQNEPTNSSTLPTRLMSTFHHFFVLNQSASSGKLAQCKLFLYSGNHKNEN